MIDRWSQEIIAFVAASAIAFGLPFALFVAFQPAYSDIGMPIGPDWGWVVSTALLMTLFGAFFFSLPLTIIRSLSSFSKVASTIVMGAVVQLVGLAVLQGLRGGYSWWGSQTLVVGAISLAGGVAASALIHRYLNFRLKIEKLSDAN